MKEIIDRIKQNYGEYKIEILLMILFVCVFVALNGKQLAGEAAEVFGRNVKEAQEEPELTDAAPEKEQMTGDGALETSGSEDETDGIAAENAGEQGTSEEESGEQGTSEEKSGKAAGEQETSEERPGKAAGEQETSEERPGKAAGEQETSEKKSGKHTLTDGKTAEPFSEEWTRALRKTLASLPADFLYPMVIPQPEEETGLTVYTLRDTRELHGWRLLLSGEEIQSFRPLAVLQTMLKNRIEGYDGDWSVYVKNLNTDESFVINDQPMKSASVMKLFIMETVYQAFEDGEMERTDEVMGLMKDMISISDNESANQLLYRLGDSSYAEGIEKVNAFIQTRGFSDMTVEYNGFNNSATNTDSSHNNQVAAKDCGSLLENIYRRSWMNRSVSNEIEEMMLNQQTRYKIPAGLPEGVLCGNKTGEMDGTENDAAIIYGKECDYILVILSGNWSSKDEAIARIAALSSMVYEFLN